MANRSCLLPGDATTMSARDLAASLRHELRTPMNAIVGSISLLERGVPQDSRERVHLERLKRTSRHLAELIDDVRDLLHTDAHTVGLSSSLHALRVVVTDSLANVELCARGRRVAIVHALTSTEMGAHYWGDERRVRQIAVNLLSNAIKFTAPGGQICITGGTLVHSTAAPSRQGAWTYLRIRDTGRGIPHHHLTTVFEPFRQVEPADRERGKGLGLAISRQFARAMNGELTVASEVGVGSVFTLWLPAHPDHHTVRDFRVERDVRELALDLTLASSFPASDAPSSLPNPYDESLAAAPVY